MGHDLIGKWRTDPTDHIALSEYGEVIMEFKKNGDLLYRILEKNKEQRIFMTYRIEDNLLITDQVSSPSVMRTQFVLSSDKTILELNFEGEISRYIRIS